MSMSKKDFIALADRIKASGPVHREHLGRDVYSLHCGAFSDSVIKALADFCASQNPRFKRGRWLAYIAGECGPNGGAVKGGPSNPWKDAPCAVAMGCLCAGHARNPKRKTCDTSEK